MSLNPDYIFRMAKLIQQERLREAASLRRWLGMKRGGVDATPTKLPPLVVDSQVEKQQKAS